MKLCLKHFRQHGYLCSFKKLTEETGVSLEDPSLTELYKLVINGCYEEVEEYMDKALAGRTYYRIFAKEMQLIIFP